MEKHFQKLKSLDSIDADLNYSDLGKTLDSAFLKIRRQLLIGNPVKESSNSESDIFKYTFASSQKEVSQVTSSSASGKGSFGLGKASANASTKKFFNSNSYSCYIFGHIKLVHPRVYIPNAQIEPNILNFIQNTSSPMEIARKLGDQVITHVGIVSELLVKFEIQTNTENQKKNVEIAASGSWLNNSGKGSFAQISGKFTDKKAIKFEVIGNISSLPTSLTAENVDQLMLNFPVSGTSKHSIVEFTTEPVENIPQLVNYDFANNVELWKRRHFIEDINNIYQDLDDWENDILYVLSPSNKSEFTLNTISQAAEDLTKISPLKLKLEEIFENAEYQWLKYGVNGNLFSPSLLSDFPNEYPIYPRVVPSSPPPPPPPKKPARERNERPDPPGGGGH